MKLPSPGIDCCCWSIVLLSLAQAVPVARGPNSGESQRLEAANSNYVDLNKVCLYENAVYAEGQNFTTSNPCETCICHPPAFACSLRTCDMKPGCKASHSANKCCPEYSCECERYGKFYGNGEKVDEPNNPCKICYCKGGEIKCSEITCYMRDDCEPIYTPGICCPKYDHCPLLDPLKNQSNTPKPSLVVISDLTTPGILENKNTSSEEASSEIPESTESPRGNSTQSQSVATLEIIEIHPNLRTTTPTLTRPKIYTTTTKIPEEESAWTENGSIATEEISNDFETTSTEVTEANDTQLETSTVPFEVNDLPPIDSNDLNLARMRNQSEENDTLSEESNETLEVNNSTSVDEDYERMENSTADENLPARVEGEEGSTEVPRDIAEEELSARIEAEEESSTNTSRDVADEELPARIEEEEISTETPRDIANAELPARVEEEEEETSNNTSRDVADEELPARLGGEEISTEVPRDIANAELPARIEEEEEETSTNTSRATADAEFPARIEEKEETRSNISRDIKDAELPARIEGEEEVSTNIPQDTSEVEVTQEIATELPTTQEPTATENVEKEEMRLVDDVFTGTTTEDLIERITIEDLMISTIAPLVESTTVTESTVKLEETNTETEDLPTSTAFAEDFGEVTARYVSSTTINFLERLEMTTFYESTTDVPTTKVTVSPPHPTVKPSGRMISDKTTEDSVEEIDENFSSANDSVESSAEELTTKRPAIYSTYAPIVDRITVVPPEKIQETAIDSSGERFENASTSEENYEFENGTSEESLEDTTNTTVKYPAEDGTAPVVVMISADQIQFLKVGEEPPLYVENPSSVPQENNKNNREEIVEPKTTPLTVEMIKVVNGKIENQTEEIDLTTEFSRNQNSTNEYLISKTDSIPTAEEDPTTKEILTNESTTSSDVTEFIQER